MVPAGNALGNSSSIGGAFASGLFGKGTVVVGCTKGLRLFVSMLLVFAVILYILS